MELRSCVKRRRTTTSSSDYWSSIPANVLLLIAGKIVSVDDYVWFTAVCRSWYLHATDFYDNSKHELNLGPLYMSGPDPDPNLITLRNPASDATFVLWWPEAAGAGSSCWGSPFGWLITYTNRNFTLVNPITGATIPLPPLPRSRTSFLSLTPMKLFLTANPESDPGNCLVVLSLGMRRVAFVRPGAKVWSHLKCKLGLHDLIRYQGNLYGIENRTGLDVQLFLFQLDHREGDRLLPRAVPILTLHLMPDEGTSKSHKNLVVLDGEFCLCVLYYGVYFRTSFKLFKFDLSIGDLTRVFSFGDQCLFLGNNYSFSCNTAYPHSTKFFEQPLCNVPREPVSNLVFYAHCSLCEGHYRPPFDVKVWDMSRSVKVFSSQTLPSSSPLWILPCINFRKLEDSV